MLYVIAADKEGFEGQPALWSNEDGWTTLDVCDKFTEQQKATFNLPIGDSVRWIPLGIIMRESLGGLENIDMSTNEGLNNWIFHVHQDEEAATDTFINVAVLGEVVINMQDPLYIERYTRMWDETNEG